MSCNPKALGAESTPTAAVCATLSPRMVLPCKSVHRLAGAVVDVGKAAGRGTVVAPETRRRRPGTCRVLPLGLGQQAIGLAGLPRQPFGVGARIVQTDANHRARSSSAETGIAPCPSGAFFPLATLERIAGRPLRIPRRRNECGILRLCHLELAHREVPRDRSPGAPGLRCRPGPPRRTATPIWNDARRHHHHLRADVAILEL